jgi:hypothetical protein
MSYDSFLYSYFIFTLYRNTINSFISGAVYRWSKAKDESSPIDPQLVRELVTSSGLKTAKNLTIVLVIAWIIVCLTSDNLLYLLGVPVGFITAIVVLKLIHKNFDVRERITASSTIVAAKAQFIGQISANDIGNNTPRYQFSNLDRVLKDTEFIKFAQKFKTTHVDSIL